MSVQISAADIVRQLRLRLGFRGPASFSLEENILPVVRIADLDAAPWNSKAGGVSFNVSGPVAAQLSYCGLQCPVTAGVGFAAVTRKLIIWAGAAMDIRIGFVTNAYLAAVIGGGLTIGNGSWDSTDSPAGALIDDARRRGVIGTYAATSATDSLPTIAWVDFPVSATPFVLDFPFCIRPGNTLLLQGKTVNIALSVSAFWDEYLAA